MSGELSIGELVGTVTLEDRFSRALEMTGAVGERFAEKMSGGFKTIAVAGAAITGIVTGITGTIMVLAEKGSHLNNVEGSFERLAGGARRADEMFRAMDKGVAGTVDSLDLMQFANQKLSTGAVKTAEQFGTITQAARVLSREGFGPIPGVMDQIGNALTTGRVRQLQYMTGVIDLKKAEETYARSINTTSDQLSQAGKVRAAQIAIYDALNKKVGEAGEMQKSLAEKFKSAQLAIGNWFDDIAKAVAKSPAVAKMFDSIGEALVRNFGGGAKTVQEAIIRWIDRFADTVAKWGPIIIDWFRKIYDGVTAIWHRVQDAWDTVPEWFKNIARDAGVAGVAVYGVQQAVLGLTSDAVISNVASFATIWSGFGSAIKTSIVFLRDWMALMMAFKWEAIALAVTNLGGAMVGLLSAPLGISALFTALGLAIWEVAKAIQAAIEWWKSGKPMWDFFSAKNDDNWVRRWLGLSNGVDETAEALKKLGEQKAGLDALMRVRNLPPGAEFMMTSRMPGSPTSQPDVDVNDRLKEREAATKASIERTAKLWDDYADLVARRMGNSLEDQLKSLDRWYAGEVAVLNKSKKDNADYVNQIAALQANLWEKKVAASEAFFMDKARKDMALLAEAIEDSFGDKLLLPIRNTSNGIVTLTDSTTMANKAIVDAMNARRPGVMTDAVRKLIGEMKDLGISAGRIAEIFGLQEDQILSWTDKVHEQLAAWADTLTQLSQVSGDTFGGYVKEIAEVVVSWQAASKAADDFRKAADEGSKAGMAMALVQGGVAMAAATGSGSRGKRVAGGALTGMEIGGAIGGPYGALIGAGVGALVGWIRGADAVEKAVNKTRQAMVDAAGGLDALNKRAVAAGGNLDAILDVRTPEAYAAAMDDLNMRFQTMEDIRAAGFQSTDDLQALADTAKRVYERMLESGRYTAEQLAKAFEDSAAAQARALRSPGQAMEDAASAAGYQTQEQLQKAADDARKLAEWMKASGRFTAEAIEDAFSKAHDAQDRAFGRNTKALDDLQAKYKSLSDSIAGEMPEEVAGVIETQIVGQMAALDKEIKDRQAEQALAGDATADAIAGSMKDAANRIGNDMGVTADDLRDGLIEAGSTAADSIAERFAGLRIRIPLEFIDPTLPIHPMAAGGAGTVNRPTLFMAGEAGTEQFAFSGAGKSFRGADAPSGGDIVIAVDGREIARAAVPHIPAELRRRGQA